MPLKLTHSSFENSIDIFYFPFGESKSSSIAAASIVAKVTRDRLMVEHFDKIIPGYEWWSNKGYSTPPHKRHVRALGHSIIHRINYLDRVWALSDDQAHQSSVLDVLYNNEEPLPAQETKKPTENIV